MSKDSNEPAPVQSRVVSDPDDCDGSGDYGLGRPAASGTPETRTVSPRSSISRMLNWPGSATPSRIISSIAAMASSRVSWRETQSAWMLS